MVGPGGIGSGVRVGVSGHRDLGGRADAVAALVDEVLDEAGAAGTAVSSLAEGADRVLAERALARDWSLHVVLPLPVQDYATDLDDPASVEELATLLAAAAHVDQIGARPTREDAYLDAGMAVVDASDLLVAVWDGAPARGRGGTADIVDEARRRALPLAWIHLDRTDEDRAPIVERERWPWPA